MTTHQPSDAARQTHRSVPSVFKYVLVTSALFIASCSAFFSVWGLGLLFVGSATAVMIMAASLEVGKLVAASFLYRYWELINRALKMYLIVAVFMLVGITSLGNYGYLARAYERTHTQIGLLESQIASLEKEITDTQHQIENSRGQLTRVSSADRDDITKLQQRIAQANDGLNQALVRIQERRKTTQDRRDRDLGVPAQRVTEQGDVLKKSLAAQESAIAGLNDRVAVLDRAVDAYTKQGGPGFFKIDSIKKGQELREQQRSERESITAELTEHQARIEQLRAEHGKQIESSDRETAAIRDQSAQELARLDAEEQALRKTHAESIAQVEQQLAKLQSQGQSTLAAGDTQVDSLYQRIRSRNEEIHRLRDQIAAVDIGSYRFVARAFEAPADDVVKWLMLALVLVFDPLAVSLVIGFNVALLKERPRPGTATPIEPGEEILVEPAVPVRRNRGVMFATSLFILALLIGGIALLRYGGFKGLGSKTRTSHANLIPGESFAVVTFHPLELKRAAPAQTFGDWLGKSAGKVVTDSVAELMKSGLDPKADVYAFVKFPFKSPAEKTDHPVMLCGFVARLADPIAAERALSRITDQLSSSLRVSSAAGASLARSRSMIRYGLGRYMDPEGGFFTFGLTDHAAIMLVEFEGDPKSPCVENEMRLCLALPDSSTTSTSQARERLPARAHNSDAAIAMWFDAGRFFQRLPKNPAAQARYQQLERHLDFDLVLKVKSGGGDQLKLIGEYSYQFDRFKDRQQPTALEFLATVGSAEGTGIGGRLMDRCMDTLDYDSLIERLRGALGGSERSGVQEVLVEKSFASTRDAQFVLSARYDPQVGPPLVTAVQTFFQ
jgi:predicted  nucleic acid-binding Zn-ribbon protein